MVLVSLARCWYPDKGVSASKKLKATMHLHPSRHPPHIHIHTHRHKLSPSVSGGARVTCDVRSPGLSLPFFPHSLPFLSSFARFFFFSIVRHFHFRLCIIHSQVFGNILVSLQCKSGGHCGCTEVCTEHPDQCATGWGGTLKGFRVNTRQKQMIKEIG